MMIMMVKMMKMKKIKECPTECMYLCNVRTVLSIQAPRLTTEYSGLSNKQV